MELLADLCSLQSCAGCGIHFHRAQSALYCGSICDDCIKRLPIVREAVCQLCGNPLMSRESICWQCRETHTYLDAFHALFFFRHPITSMIHSYKQYGRRDLEQCFSHLIHQKLQELHIIAPIVSVPCLPLHKKKRGFDPVIILGKRLKKEFDYTFLQCITRKKGQSQKELGYHDRQKSLHNKLYIDADVFLRGEENVVLIDDVCTTGASLNACAQLLKENGIQRCVALCLAKTLDY